MKKTLLFLFLLTTTCLMAQTKYFELTPEGLQTINQSSSDYLVLDFPGQSKEDLYKRTLIYLNTIYNSPKDVLSPVENEVIAINGFASESVRRNSLHVFDMNYSFNIRFKEDKIRVDIPSLTLTTFTDKKQVLHIEWDKFSFGGADLGIYKKGKLKSKKAKEDIENYFNNLINHYVSSLEKKANDW